MFKKGFKSKITFLALLLSPLLFTSQTLAESDSKTIDIGIILPLSGDATYWGSNPRKGLELAIKDLEKENGSKIKLHIEDDACDPKKAVTAFHKLTDIDKVKIILGPACSSCSLSIAPLAAKKNVLLFVYSEADSLSGIPNVFRMWAPNGRQAIALARYASKFKSVATLSIENAYGNDLSSHFSKELELIGQKVLLSETYLAENAGDLKTQLIKIKSKKPDALLFISYIKDGALLVKQAKNFGFNIPLLGASTINNTDFYSQLGPLADGIVLSDVADSSSDNFRKRWETEFNEPWPGMQRGGSLFYDILKVINIANKSGVTTVSDMKDYLFALKGYVGESGKVEFDKNGDLKWKHTLFKVQDSKAIPLEIR